MKELELLLPWATGPEKEAVQAILETGSFVKAAKKLGRSRSTIRNRIAHLKKRAARNGFSPEHDMTHAVPEPFHVKGVSTLYGRNGDIKLQWVKSQKDHEEKYEDLIAAVEVLADPFKGTSKIVKAPKGYDKNLMSVIPIGDPHIGMHAWYQETGANFDLRIAERNMVAAVDSLVDLSPRVEECLVVSLGDFFHADNKKAETTLGTRVDVDSRWAKVYRVGIRIMDRAIEKALEKAKKVFVYCVTGNHDELTSQMLALLLAAKYENNPRVYVETSPHPFFYHEFGQNLIGMNHGHLAKRQDLPGIMSVDRKEAWGRTTYRYWLTGHVHHQTLTECYGCIIESFRTLASSDAWHTGKGYRSGRDLHLHVHHKEYGRIQKFLIGVNEIEGKQKR